MSIQITDVFDPSFASYGKVLTGYDTAPLIRTLNENTPRPADCTQYEASSPVLEALPIFSALKRTAYAGMEIQAGWCNGFNTKLNALEYHRGSELNIPADDIVLLLARITEVTPEGTIDSSKVKAFFIPKGTIVQVYETTLHFAPCCPVRDGKAADGFRVAVVLPRGTNTPLGEHEILNEEDKRLWMKNKWLIAHPESKPASKGAFTGITGPNLDLTD